MMVKYDLNQRYEPSDGNYFNGYKDVSENSGLVSVLDEPKPGELIDEPTPEVIDSCCCPCIKPINPGPFLAFCPLE